MALLRFVQTCVQVVYGTVCTQLHLCKYQYIPLPFWVQEPYPLGIQASQRWEGAPTRKLGALLSIV